MIFGYSPSPSTFCCHHRTNRARCPVAEDTLDVLLVTVPAGVAVGFGDLAHESGCHHSVAAKDGAILPSDV